MPRTALPWRLLVLINKLGSRNPGQAFIDCSRHPNIIYPRPSPFPRYKVIKLKLQLMFSGTLAPGKLIFVIIIY